MEEDAELLSPRLQKGTHRIKQEEHREYVKDDFSNAHAEHGDILERTAFDRRVEQQHGIKEKYHDRKNARHEKGCVNPPVAHDIPESELAKRHRARLLFLLSVSQHPQIMDIPSKKTKHIQNTLEKRLAPFILVNFIEKLAVLDEQHAVAITRRNRIMRHHDDRRPFGLIDKAQQFEHFLGRFRVEIPRRFIRQNKLRLMD